MRIVYGVSGEGLGHVREAIEIAEILQREGHLVKVLTYGERACESLGRFHPTRIEGLPLYFDEKGLSLVQTIGKNLHCIPFYVRNWGRLKQELRAFRPDVFLTAYEPFTTIAAHVLRRPLVSMDNQNELRFLRPPAGRQGFAFRVARLATRICTYGADWYIVKSFTPFTPGRRDVRVVFPIIQAEIRKLQPREAPYVLVYLTKPNPGLIRVLQSLAGEVFHVYSHNQAGEAGNVRFRPPGPGFLRDLGDCKAIIATAGFSLIADALYLRKPYFAVPLKKQFEQTHNANFLRRSGFGASAESPTRNDLEQFLARLDQYRERLAGYRFNPAEQEEMLLGILKTIEAAPDRDAAVTGACP